MYDDAQLDQDVCMTVQQFWVEKNAPLLLSQLGLLRLSTEAKNFVSENNISLKRYIRSRLSNTVRFVPMLQQGGALTPVAETITITDAELERLYKDANLSSSQHQSRIRVDRNIWLAFRDPLPEGMQRAINLSIIPPTVREITYNTALEKNELSVEAEDVATMTGEQIPLTAIQVKHAIKNWCDKHKVDFKKLSVNPQLEAKIVSAHPRDRNHIDKAASASVTAVGFVDVLRSIPKEQLTRISVPGDALLSILERLSNK